MATAAPPAAERRVTVPMMMRAAETRPSSYREADNSIEVVWTTGAAVTRFDWWDGEYYDETLSLEAGAVRLDRLNAGAPFLDSHDDWSLSAVLGSVEPGSAAVDGQQGVARVRLSGAADVADQVLKIREGHVRNVSVGYAVHAYEIIEPTAGSNARKEMRAVDWEPMEISAVAIPADAGAQVRAKRSRSQAGHACIIRGASAQSKDSNMPDPTPTPAPAPAPTPEPAVTPPDAGQRTAPTASGLAVETIMARAKPLGAEFALTLVERNAKAPMSELDLERAINDHYAEKNKMPEIDNAITVQRDAGDKWVEGAVHGIIARAGLTAMVEKAAKARGDTLRITPGEFRGVRLAALAAEGLARAGVKVATRRDDEIVELALRHAQQSRSAIITQTTSDFSTVLENTMNKVVQAAYMVAPDSWRRWCKVGSVTDFRDQNRYLLGSFGALDAVGDAGEIKNKPIPDGAKQPIRAGTKANIINLSRNAIVNDDLGAFSELATGLGRAAKLSIEVDAYALLNSNPTMADGYALFSTQHGNLAASGSAPSVTSIDEGRVAMAQQKDVSGNEFLDIRPSIWLGPLSLGSTVRVINDSPYDPDATNKLQRPNPVGKIFEDVIDTPRLTGTAWYEIADPDMYPSIEVVFLNGDEEPKVDSMDGWRTLGVEWRVIHDYGVGAVNFRSIRKNPGA